MGVFTSMSVAGTTDSLDALALPGRCLDRRSLRRRLSAAGPPEQLAAAVGALAAHLVRAGGTERAFITGDAGVSIMGKRPVAAFAGGSHVKHGYQ